MPTSIYWREIPDAGRNYLNRTFFEDIHSKFGEVEVRRFLNQYKIDYRDKSYNIPVLREYIYKHLNYAKRADLEKQRIRSIFNSEVFYSQLKQSRQKYAEERIASPEFPAFMTQEIKRHFL